MTRNIRTVLAIGGSDSGGGAGVQADLKTLAAHGVHGLCAIAAVTAQSTVAVRAVHPMPADVVVAQIDAVASDIGVDAVKTGMLWDTSIVEAVVRAIDGFDLPFVVVDPVMVATSGERLLKQDALTAMRLELLPSAYIVTPNRSEAELLADMAIHSLDDMREAALRIHRLGPEAVVIKGGHMPGNKIVDLLFDGRDVTTFTSPRIQAAHTHGTGCAFAASLAAGLALGRSLVEATEGAKSYVERAIRHAHRLGHGAGALDHFAKN